MISHINEFKNDESKSTNNFNTPVLFLVFNRMDTTKSVFNAIRQAKPSKLYIASDGARKHKLNEINEVESIRHYVLSHIDWDCDIKTLFRETNLGCKRAVSEAITWFFESESKGIILEDDCLPNQSFFRFCEEMLNYYKDDMRIWHISGNNFQWGNKRGEGDYYFSNYTHIWGWATWADRWQHYDVDMKNFEDFKRQQIIMSIFENEKEQRFWLDAFNITKTNKISAWDYQWSYCAFINNGLSILPNKNLVKNIGFGNQATHTHDENSKFSNIETVDIDFPIKHPDFLVIDKAADRMTAKEQFAKKNFKERILNKVRKILNV